MHRPIPELSEIYHLLLSHSVQKASLLVEHGSKQPAAHQSGFFCEDLDKLGRKKYLQLRFTLYLLYMGLFVGLINDFCSWGR